MKVVAYKDKQDNLHAIKKDQVRADLKIDLNRLMLDDPMITDESDGRVYLNAFDKWFDSL